MKIKYFLNFIACFILFTNVCPSAPQAQQTLTGGYNTVPVDNKEVVAAAAFAIEAQKKAIQEKTGGKPANLELITILKAEQQVVAGMNYRLTLKVKLNGKEKTAETIVWWQAWRRPNPYQLTSWAWE
jgi:hypothetical protein